MPKPIPPLVQITIHLNGGILSYEAETLFPPGGTAVTPVGATGKRHKIQKGTNIQWICADNFSVLFATSPFRSKHTTLSKPQNTPTDPETATKKGNGQKYGVVVYPPGVGSIGEDPELDVSDDGGGGRKKSTPKKKKSASKKR